MHALLILDMQVGLFHGPDKPWRGERLLATLNELIVRAQKSDCSVFFARHIGPVGSPIERGSPLTELVGGLALNGTEIIFEKSRPNAFVFTALAEQLRSRGVETIVVAGMKTQYCVDSTCRAARDLGFETILIEDGHTCSDTPLLSAESIINHHNSTLAGAFCRVMKAEECDFK
ncbi:nicotinamidase-related amidase [Pseudomonas duriflava]|uniref:Nicotinamidase-related amidase n=1 Tax=Pseudomonas duriflava TaxID=459528 RepID=A0A562PX07_9PSED|nr:cysteine hydrolase family protein [Pseudomonas duriflava]TWI48981.1 nicotinamidase-related amidase [Pseudomonas duriflava]